MPEFLQTQWDLTPEKAPNPDTAGPQETLPHSSQHLLLRVARMSFLFQFKMKQLNSSNWRFTSAHAEGGLAGDAGM